MTRQFNANDANEQAPYEKPSQRTQSITKQDNTDNNGPNRPNSSPNRICNAHRQSPSRFCETPKTNQHANDRQCGEPKLMKPITKLHECAHTTSNTPATTK